MHPHRQALWGDIWQRTVVKNQTNATNVTLHLHRQVIWGDIWKRNGEKSNKCNQCDYASSREGNFRTHLKTHSGEKLNKCNQCDYASSRADVLRTLLKAHNGEKSNKCNQCDFAPSLRTRLKTHSGGCRRFEEAENTQWRKVKQMQPVLLCIISCRQFKETLKNVWTLLRWRKRVQLMWLWIITRRLFLAPKVLYTSPHPEIHPNPTQSH